MLTRSGWLALLGAGVAFLGGRIFGLIELYLIGCGLFVLVLAAVGRVRWSRLDLRVGRHLSPRRVHAGQPARVELTVQNRSLRPTPVLRLHDPVTNTQGATVLLSPIETELTVQSAYRLPTERRGLVGIGPLSVVVADPFGLAALKVPAAQRTELTVLPRVDDILPPPMAGGDEPLSGMRTASLAASAGDDFASLRKYVVGDDLRRVHWPASARHDDLVVRQDEVHWQGRTTVVLDTRSGTHTVDSFELAVSAAASVIAASWKRRDLIRLVTTGGWDSGIAAGHGHAERLLDELAKVALAQPGSLRGTIAGLGRSGSGAVVVVGGAIPVAEVSALAAGAISGRHALTVVATGEVGRTGLLGGEVIALDGPQGFVAAWNAQMSRPRRFRRTNSRTNVTAGTQR